MITDISDFSPFLTLYETIIPRNRNKERLKYSESRMIMLYNNNRPAACHNALKNPSTILTRVKNETTDET